MSEWMDIASAPKDGTWILMVADGIYEVINWCADHGRWEDSEGLEADGVDMRWQPLPPPPKRKVKKTVEAWANVNADGKIVFLRSSDGVGGADLSKPLFDVRLTGEYEVEE